MYRDGRGVQQNYTTAVSWYRKAADQGNTIAQSNLGLSTNRGSAEALHGVAAKDGKCLADTSQG
jgi:TPR repeat protein